MDYKYFSIKNMRIFLRYRQAAKVWLENELETDIINLLIF